MSDAEARTPGAQAAVTALRYAGDNYYWINDSRPFMVVHPLKPELDGKDLSDNKDPNGVRLFVTMAEVCRAGRRRLRGVLLAEAGARRARSRSSLTSSATPKWDWIIGSGVYVDDIEDQVAAAREDPGGLRRDRHARPARRHWFGRWLDDR